MHRRSGSGTEPPEGNHRGDFESMNRIHLAQHYVTQDLRGLRLHQD